MRPNVHYANNALQILAVRCRESHSRPTTPHGPHLVGLVEEAGPTPLEQKLDVLVNTAAGKLPGQMESAWKSQTGRDQEISREQKTTAAAAAAAEKALAPVGHPRSPL